MAFPKIYPLNVRSVVKLLSNQFQFHHSRFFPRINEETLESMRLSIATHFSFFCDDTFPLRKLMYYADLVESDRLKQENQ